MMEELCVLCYNNAYFEGKHKLLMNKIPPFDKNICLHHVKYSKLNFKDIWMLIYKNAYMYINSGGSEGLDINWLNQNFDFNNRIVRI